jgi:transposase
MARTVQISKEKLQSIITLRHKGQSIENISRTLNVFSSAVAKTIKHYDETGSHEDPHRKGRPRVTSAAENKFIRVNCTSDFSPNKCFRVKVTDTSQHQLFRGDYVNHAFMFKLLQRNHY